jgi:putative tryptophan/tyrosine transport system substrate-binding protein
MDRRGFVTFLGSAAAWPLTARAQPQMPVVGFLNSSSSGGFSYLADAFRQGLKETGYVEGQNVAVEYRWAEGQYDRVPIMALELVSRRQVAVIVANAPGARVLKAAITTIPIVFTMAGDPVQGGLVESLARPGGNVTGITQLNEEVAPKRLQIMRELLPAATMIGALVNPTNPQNESLLKDLHTAADTLGFQLHVLNASAERDFDVAFATLAQLRASALVIAPDGFLLSQSEQLAALAVRHAVPTIFQDRPFVTAGGLMSYGGSTEDSYRLAGVYTGRILKGEKPAVLPVQQVTKIELIVNMKTAKAFGLTVPITLLGRADEVIE